MLDNLIVGLYLLVILSLGIYNRTRAITLNDYNSLGINLQNNKWLLTATIFATAVGGGTTFGIVEKAFSTNLAFTYGLLLSVPIDILIAIYLIPRLAQYSGITSIGEIIEYYYGKSGRIITGIAATLISIGYLAAQISVSGRIFEFLVGSSYIEGVIISYLVVIAYTTFGGLKSVVINNFFQFIAMIAAIPLIMSLGFYHLGLQPVLDSVPAVKYSLVTPRLLNDTIFAALSFSVMGFYPSFIQRTLISKNSNIITGAIFYKSIIYVIFLICLTFNGLIAAELIPDVPSNNALLTMINMLAPTGLKGLIMVGLLAAVMSTADSDLNIASVSLVNDVFKPIINIQNQRLLLIMNQIFTILIGVFAIFMAIMFKSIVDLVIFAAGFWAPMIVVPLINILYRRITTVNYFIFSSLAGGGTFLGWEMFGSKLYHLSGVFVGTMVCLVIFTLAPTKTVPQKI